MNLDALWQPLTLRPGVVARNRIWLAPLTNQQSHADGQLAPAEEHFLRLRAEGGFGVVETCAAYVAPEGKAWPGELGVHEDAMEPGLTRLAGRIHDAGALACAQLFHGGLRASSAVSGHPTWSASAHAEPDLEVPRAASEADILAVIDAFTAAAKRCARAGFDAVELHGAHGYLLSQFQSTLYNQRTDRWGGSEENRHRLIRTIARSVRATVPDIALVVRLSPEDFGQARGIDLHETVRLARHLVDDGVDVLHLSLWNAAAMSRQRPDAHPTTLFRDAVGTDAKIVVAGGIWTASDAIEQLHRGADAVAVGRAAIAFHDWPQRLRDGRPTPPPPFTPEHLGTEGLSPPFVTYMRRWKGFVAE